MNRRTRPSDADKRAVHELVEFAMTHTADDIFVEWSPHCELVTARIYVGGHTSEANADFSAYAYFGGETAITEFQSIEHLLAGVRAFVAKQPKPEPDPLGLLEFARAERSAA